MDNHKIRLALVATFVWAAVQGNAAVPSAEKLLPDDTLLMVTAPDFVKMRDIFRASPQSRLWNDPAMKSFKEKFLARWTEEFLKPLERELKLHFDDYTSLPEGQLTFALTRNGSADNEDQPMGKLLLLETRDKSNQLKTNLAGLRNQWVDAGKSIKTEKIRDFEFSVLAVSSNDIPKTFRKFFPQRPQVQELGSEEESKKAAPRSELVIGQADSLLIIGNSTKVVEKIVARLTGGSVPSLGELAAYDANDRAFFRAAPLYGWVNVKGFVERSANQASEKKEQDNPDPLANIGLEKLVAAMGLMGLKTFAFSFQNSNEGSMVQLFFGVPEAGRQGIFKLLAGEARESTPPAFVPGDVVKFQRWRVDGQKAWVALEKTLGDISPQLLGGLNFLLDAATIAAKEKDPGFDVKKSLVGNLGDDLIRYEKAPRGSSPAALRSPPSLLLLGSPNPDQLAAALRSVLAFLNQQGGAAVEREFLGRKIFSMPLPALPLPIPVAAKPTAPRTLNCAASGGYVAMSTDASMLEEFLRSSESRGKMLRETAGLAEAAQQVTGPGTLLFGYQNQVEQMRVTLELLKKDPAGATNTPMTSLPAILGLPNPQAAFQGLMDFSLLPAFDKLAKYFHFTVYAGSASMQGLTLKFFAPAPPQLQ